jgi:DNA-binding response OmpR family regulator
MANILVVDDDPDIGTMLKMMLEFKGYGVILINRAHKTFDVLSQNQVDLVILDMLIAGDNGTDVCTSIRNNKFTSQLPVMMISALPDARQGCIQAGANEFISKPFEMQDLLSKVQHLINGRGNITQSVAV